MTDKKAEFRFYEELNDFLSPEKKKKSFTYRFSGSPSVKDAIEALGVPHTEVDLLLVNGISVGFDHLLHDGDRVAVYPLFENFDISPLVRLRQYPLRTPKFVLDVHLGKLARQLRMLGFDTLYHNNYPDSVIIYLSLQEKRIILTRDRGLLKNKAITHGYWIRATDPREQIREVLTRFDLHSQIRPFHRCIACNGKITQIEKQKIRHRLEPKTDRYYHDFYICNSCEKIYWKGSHYEHMNKYIAKLADHHNREP